MSRRSPKRLFRLASTLAVFIILITACAIPYVPSRTVYEDPVNFVRLEIDDSVLPEWPPGHHEHPIIIPPDQLRAILLGIKVQERRIFLQRWLFGDAPLVQAFTDEEVALLATEISQALAEARYNERVTFYLSQPQTSAKRIITTGGLYVQNDQLHFLLGNWQIVYGIPTYGMIYDRRYPMRPTAAKGFDLFFLPEDAVVPFHSSLLDALFANDTDELVLDLAKIKVPESQPAPVSSVTSSLRP